MTVFNYKVGPYEFVGHENADESVDCVRFEIKNTKTRTSSMYDINLTIMGLATALLVFAACVGKVPVGFGLALLSAATFYHSVSRVSALDDAAGKAAGAWNKFKAYMNG